MSNKLVQLYMVELEFPEYEPGTTVISTDGLEALIKRAVSEEFARLREKFPVDAPLITPVDVSDVSFETQFEVEP